MSEQSQMTTYLEQDSGAKCTQIKRLF